MARIVSTERLQEGMILAHDLSTQFGQLIARKGQVISARLIPLLRSFGITEVEIVNAEEEEHPVLPEEIQVAELELKEWFKSVDRKDPLIEELFRLCVVRRARHNRGHPAHQKV